MEKFKKHIQKHRFDYITVGCVAIGLGVEIALINNQVGKYFDKKLQLDECLHILQGDLVMLQIEIAKNDLKFNS